MIQILKEYCFSSTSLSLKIIIDIQIMTIVIVKMKIHIIAKIQVKTTIMKKMIIKWMMLKKTKLLVILIANLLNIYNRAIKYRHKK